MAIAYALPLVALCGRLPVAARTCFKFCSAPYFASQLAYVPQASIAGAQASACRLLYPSLVIWDCSRRVCGGVRGCLRPLRRIQAARAAGRIKDNRQSEDKEDRLRCRRCQPLFLGIRLLLSGVSRCSWAAVAGRCRRGRRTAAVSRGLPVSQTVAVAAAWRLL